MTILPQISGLIARQVGSIQGKVTAQVQSRVLDMLSKFSSECPTSKELQKIINQRSNLLSVINSFESRISQLGNAADRFNGVISGLKAAIQVIKSIPLPTAIIPPMSGGVGIPVSILTRYSDALIQLNNLVDALEADRQGVVGIINTASSTLANLKSRLESLDLLIQECSTKSPNLSSIINQAQPKENTGSEGTPNADYLYKGYTLEIVQDPNSPKIAPKRYAIAKDKVGLIVLYGPSSFSSDTNVLLQEIKFRIDNQLP